MRIGIDLGGSKVEGIVLAEELSRLRVATPSGDYGATLQAVARLVGELEAEAGIEAARRPVGIGIPGTLSPASGLIKNANSTCLIGHPLDDDLTRLLDRPVRLANDANCFAVSEAVDGAAAGARVVFGVILGTGVGGGIVVDGRCVTGVNAIAGEWGHNPLPWPGDEERPGPECYCGLSGCIETFLSGPGLAADYSRGGGEGRVTAKQIAAMDSAPAIAAIERYQHRLARALGSVINILDADVIVLGGGLSNMSGLYDTVPELWRQWVFSDRVDTVLVRNGHGDSSGVRGAAWLWDTDAN
jgi:fructokinase